MVNGIDSNMIASTSFSYAMTELYRTMKKNDDEKRQAKKPEESKKAKKEKKGGDKNNNRICSQEFLKQHIKHLMAKIDAFC